MSVVHAVAQATLSPSSSASPVVQAAVAVHAVATQSSLTDILNKLSSYVSSSDLIVAAGILVTALQGFINRSKWLQHEIAVVQDARRFTLAVALPFIGTYITTLASGQNDLKVAPWIFLVSQLTFYVVKALKNSAPVPVAALATETPAVG